MRDCVSERMNRPGYRAAGHAHNISATSMAERGFSTYMTPRSVGITPAGGLTPRVRNPLDSSLDFASIARADNMQIVRANMAGSATDVDAVATIVTRGRGMDDTVAIIPALPKIALYWCRKSQMVDSV
ncbi:uncharacterized protein RSE6_07120 [Rhynchosporium secalis]|uniref:Uncharacterized protein n=1 Tax=Rhynchosporium secalis TaxID=38038 RepID=A0A1E1MC68_RHYSE|nr:uncharacterized protein RSE6_07120 [Rhynchosporium secalis]